MSVTKNSPHGDDRQSQPQHSPLPSLSCQSKHEQQKTSAPGASYSYSHPSKDWLPCGARLHCQGIMERTKTTLSELNGRSESAGPVSQSVISFSLSQSCKTNSSHSLCLIHYNSLHSFDYLPGTIHIEKPFCRCARISPKGYISSAVP